MACRHDDLTLYKGRLFGCYCKLLKAGKIVAVEVENVDKVCPLKKVPR